MPFQNSVSEQNGTATTTVTGTLNTGATAGLVVSGVHLAGLRAGNVGLAYAGIFGTLTVEANGDYSYALNNADVDTDLLSAGDVAYDRFVITYRQGATLATLDLDIAINGIDEPGQQVEARDTPLVYYDDMAVPAGSHLAFSSGTGLRMHYSVSDPVTVTNAGAISVRQDDGPFTYGVEAGGHASAFRNSGRVAVRSGAGTYSVWGATSDIGRNDGVLSAVQSNTGVQASFLARAIGWNVGTAVNTGLIEAISTYEAFGVWGYGDFTNAGLILVQGGMSDDPLGIIGYRSGGSVGQHFVNSGTIRVSSTVPGEETVGLHFFPSSSNPYQPMWIDNSGTIVAGTAIDVTEGYNVSTHLANSGHIEGRIVLDGGINVVANTGSIVGEITLGRESDLLANAGTITGSIHLAAMGDAYVASGGGSVSGTVHGDDGNDLLRGGDAADRLSGDAGNDWIAGGGGADVLAGGEGADLFAYLAAGDSTLADRDVIADFQSGTDRIDISALGAATFTLAPAGERTILSVATAQGTLSVAITGTVTAADIVNATPGDTIEGTGGNDALVALVTGSALAGREGDDLLFGSPGDDLLYGGIGHDAMFGGEGNDVYLIEDGENRVIEAEGGGIDEVRTVIDYSLQAYVENAVLAGGDPIGVLGNGLDNVIVGNPAPNFISGAGGNDTLYGGGGSDYIQVGTGASTIIYLAVGESPAGGADFINLIETGANKVDLTALPVTGLSFEYHPEEGKFFNGPQMAFPVYVYGWTRVKAATPDGDLVLEFGGVQVNATHFLWNPPPEPPPAAFRLVSAPGWTGAVGGNGSISGTNGFDDIALLQGWITLDGSFNRGGDVIRLDGAAQDFAISRSGSSTALVTRGDGLRVAIPVGQAGLSLDFEDGARTLRVDSGGYHVGAQDFSGQPVPITAPPQAPAPAGGSGDAQARLVLLGAPLQPGQEAQITIGGNVRIAGTNGADVVAIAGTGGRFVFDGSFNRGGDTLVLPGHAADYTAARQGSSTVTVTGHDATLAIPIGRAGLTLHFADGDRLLAVADGKVMLGAQEVAGTIHLDPPAAPLAAALVAADSSLTAFG